MRKTKPYALHPAGESPFYFKFVTSAGVYHLKAGDDKLTAYGGLVAWAHFMDRTGIADIMAAAYPVARISPIATPIRDILVGFMFNCLVGGTRFAHMRRLQDDRAVAQILGLAKGRLCGEDTFRRLCEVLQRQQARDWMAHGEQLVYQALPQNSIAD